MRTLQFALTSLIIFINVNILAINYNVSHGSTVHHTAIDQCLEIISKNKLEAGWYTWRPYQFNQVSSTGYNLTGMDIELVRAVASDTGIDINYREVKWSQHQNDLKSGDIDLASGATFDSSRANYAYFSVPYRFEENSLFMLKDSEKMLNFENITAFLSQVRLQNMRLGLTDSFTCGDLQVNEFTNDEANKDIIFRYDNELQLLQALIRMEIDGFIADKIVGAAVILENSANKKVKEVELQIHTPIHLMFSKKTVPISLVDHFNKKITQLVESKEYKKITKAYLYPVLLMRMIDSKWFYMLGVIGTIAFAISGVAIAAQENTTLFGTFLLAMLPSVAGGIIRDVMISRDPISIILDPTYMYYILIVVLLGFAITKLLGYYDQRATEDSFTRSAWNNLLIICDAAGQAAFVIIGVVVVIMAKIEPIILWGPFFAFLSSNGGGILRDLIRQGKVISCLSENFNAEISIIWGLAFSVFIDMNAYNPNAANIKHAVIIVATGAFISRLIFYYLKIPNIRFR